MRILENTGNYEEIIAITPATLFVINDYSM